MRAATCAVAILLVPALLSAVCLALDQPRRSYLSPDSSEPEDGPFDVTELPGFDGPLPARHRAGYVTVAPSAGRRLYYYLAGSESPAAAEDPLIIWLTGGPGCSSLDAFAYEHGPFTFRLDPAAGGPGVRLERNPHAWSRLGHILYVDSPAGTGMSYERDPPKGGYRTDDGRTVEDLLALVLGVLEDMPDLRGRDVYIAGESYGGVYVPLLAERILRHNEEAATKLRGAEAAAAAGRRRRRRVDLVGYVVGNGVTDDEIDGNSQVPFAWGAGLLDRDTHDFAQAACGRAGYWNATRGSKCWDALDVIDDAIGDVNPYDILSPCFFPRRRHVVAGDEAAGGQAGARRRWPFIARFGPAGAPVGNWWRAARALAAAAAAGGGAASSAGNGGLGHVVPCADRRAALAYFNDPDVRRAIHAAPARDAGRWEPCSDVLHYTHTAPSMVPAHRRLAASGLRALVFSGLSDYVVPFTGTRRWTAGLELPIEFPWRPWKLGGQVAGHAVRYRGEGGGPLTYATIVGAGHMAAQTSPAAALGLLRAWLERQV